MPQQDNAVTKMEHTQENSRHGARNAQQVAESSEAKPTASLFSSGYGIDVDDARLEFYSFDCCGAARLLRFRTASVPHPA
jgi:hypothetical protein